MRRALPRIGRRRFGAGAASAILASLAFGAFVSRDARADTNAAKRLVVFFSPNGTIHPFWRPTGTETDFAFPAGGILEPLGPIKDDIVVCDGVDFIGFQNHEPGM